MSTQQPGFPVIRGRAVRVDDNGLVCLTDIWRAAGFSVHQSPAQWQRLPFVTQMMTALLKRNVGKSHDSKISMKSIIYSTRGGGGGTFADMRLALAYAEYLNADLALEVKEVFLRYKAADPTLADDILQRAAPEANEWAGTRALGRSVRNQYTKTLQDHGAHGQDFARCTNALYGQLFDKDAGQLKRAKGVPAKGNLRDAMTTPELVYVMASETLSTERINEEECATGTACFVATSKSARFIRQAIEADRNDRKGRQGKLGFGG